MGDGDTDCHPDDGDSILSAIYTTSYVVYIISALVSAVIIFIIIYRKGHWIAWSITMAYALSCCLKGFAFASWTDSGNGIT